MCIFTVHILAYANVGVFLCNFFNLLYLLYIFFVALNSTWIGCTEWMKNIYFSTSHIYLCITFVLHLVTLSMCIFSHFTSVCNQSAWNFSLLFVKLIFNNGCHNFFLYQFQQLWTTNTYCFCFQSFYIYCFLVLLIKSIMFGLLGGIGTKHTNVNMLWVMYERNMYSFSTFIYVIHR